MGGAETETTLARNRIALDCLAFRPRVLRDVEKVSTKAKVLGQELRLPIILAPIGSLQDFAPDGGAAPARAAAKFGVLHMLSSACAPGLEAVAKCVDYPKIFQLYVRGDTAWVDDYIARAVDNGYIALCLTVDLDYYGRRERDLAKRYLTSSRRSKPADHFQARFSWTDVARLKAKFKIPLILKGIATAGSLQRRTPGSRSSMASKASTFRTTAAGSSITARGRSPYCPKWWKPLPARRKSWSTAASCAGPTS
jgi:glycolate oxidase